MGRHAPASVLLAASVFAGLCAAQSAPKPPKPPPLPDLPPQGSEPAEPPEPLDPDTGRGLLGLFPPSALDGDARRVEHPSIRWSLFLGGEIAARPAASAARWMVPLADGTAVWLDAARGEAVERGRLPGRPVGRPAPWGRDLFVSVDPGGVVQVRGASPPRWAMRTSGAPSAGPTVTGDWLACPTDAGWEALERATGRVVRAPGAARNAVRVGLLGDSLVAAQWGALAGFELPAARRLWSRSLPGDVGCDLLVLPERGLVVAGTDTGVLDALAASDGSRAWRASGPSGVVGIAREDDRIVVTRRHGGVDLIDAASGRLLASRELGGAPVGEAVAVEGTRARWAAVLRDGAVVFLDEALNPLLRVELSAPPRDAPSSGGSFVLVAVGRSLLYRIDAP